MTSLSIERPTPLFRVRKATSCKLVGAAAWASVAIICGCSSLTRVDSPDLTQPSQFGNPPGALTLRAGALGAFAGAFSRQAAFSGLLTDELTLAPGVTFTQDIDRRGVAILDEQVGTDFPYPDLSAARVNTLLAIAAMERYQANRGDLIGELFALVAYSETFFSEDMCSGVPMALIVNGAPAYGPALARAALRQQALSDFDSAEVHARGNSDSIVTLARIGKARVLRDSGDLVDAARIADSVPDGYTYQVAEAQNSSTQVNEIFNQISLFPAWSVSDREGVNGLPFISAADPRLPIVPVPAGSGTAYAPVKYSNAASPITLADWIEARLIEAEASLQAGDSAGWLTMLNSLRSNAGVAGLPPLVDPGTDTARVSLTYYERAFWLYGTGHRQADLLLLMRQYQRLEANVFPTGPYGSTGLEYGSDVTFAPFAEQGDPAFHGCLTPVSQ